MGRGKRKTVALGAAADGTPSHDGERQCIELYFFKGLSCREVGDKTGTDPSSAYRAIQRAIRKLHVSAEKGEGNLARAMPKAPRFRKPD